jgi:hypothetical protein
LPPKGTFLTAAISAGAAIVAALVVAIPTWIQQSHTNDRLDRQQAAAQRADLRSLRRTFISNIAVLGIVVDNLQEEAASDNCEFPGERYRLTESAAAAAAAEVEAISVEPTRSSVTKAVDGTVQFNTLIDRRRGLTCGTLRSRARRLGQDIMIASSRLEEYLGQ